MTNHHIVYEIMWDVNFALLDHDDIPLSEYGHVARGFSALSGALPATEIHGGITACLDGENERHV